MGSILDATETHWRQIGVRIVISEPSYLYRNAHLRR